MWGEVRKNVWGCAERLGERCEKMLGGGRRDVGERCAGDVE